MLILSAIMFRLGRFLAYGLVLWFLSQGYLQAQKQLQPPATAKKPVADTVHGSIIRDEYRWLEDDQSTETRNWVKAQQAYTESYLGKIPFRNKLQNRLKGLAAYERFGGVARYGNSYFFTRNDGTQNQPVYYIRDGLDGPMRPLINPNKWSNDGSVSAAFYQPSPSGRYVAYGVSQSGSDWTTIYVWDAVLNRPMPDTVRWAKFTTATWLDNDGFYYQAMPEVPASAKLTGVNQSASIRFHKLGTPSSTDAVVYEDPTQPRRTYGVELTSDGDYLFLSLNGGAGAGNALSYARVPYDGKPVFTPLIREFDHQNSLVDGWNNGFILLTDIGAPNRRVVWVDPKNPAPDRWRVLVPETKDQTLVRVERFQDELLVVAQVQATHRLQRWSLTDGQLLGEVRLPGLGTISGLVHHPTKHDETFVWYASYNSAPTVYRYVSGGTELTPYLVPRVPYDPSQYEVKQVLYPSKDGTEVSMFIISARNTVLNGSNPCFLYGYGGFNISLTPSYVSEYFCWLENGGIVAIPNLRGGGEYGEAWHKAGMKEKKQNVFDDFIAAADYLVKNNYTTYQKIVLHGRSNGGLLVGAVMTQRPDICAVALPGVGVLDMLRFHKFTIGWAWMTEYGNPDVASDWDYLKKYSPYHNLKPGLAYPATMVLTADHDDRVVPAHSFKFGARLQAYHSGTEPILLRIETSAGHGAGKSLARQIAEHADMYSFVFQQLGMKPRL